MSDDEGGQRVVRVPGSRRARLTPAPGTDTEPEAAVPGAETDAPAAASDRKGPNDDRLRQDVPPHY